MKSLKIIGRIEECEILEEFYNSNKAEFLAIYGRRRVGKTYLIREFFNKKPSIFFHITGEKEVNLQKQIANFMDIFAKTFFNNSLSLKPMDSWKECFNLLTNHIEETIKNKKIVLFFDELPWLASRKSGFLQALDYYWNRFWSSMPNVKLVICGSAASWIINNIINNKGGLHNRITKLIALQPFTLDETKEFLKYRKISLNKSQIVELYMSIGGIALYLENITKGMSTYENIDKLCFHKNGLLFNEFNNLFSSLFNNYEIYEELIRIISLNRYGISQSKLLKEAKLSSLGGRAKKRLQELEEAGFIMSFIPHKNKEKGIYYKVIDEYVLFYLTWIEPVRSLILKRKKSKYWITKSKTAEYNIWSGYAFEALCFKHIDIICEKLDIDPGADIATWKYIPKTKKDIGAQIDLLFDRTDDVITICEIKYTKEPFIIDKAYYKNLLNKIDVYKKAVKTNKQIFVVFIAANGIKKNIYSEEIITKYITLKDLYY